MEPHLIKIQKFKRTYLILSDIILEVFENAKIAKNNGETFLYVGNNNSKRLCGFYFL